MRLQMAGLDLQSLTKSVQELYRIGPGFYTHCLNGNENLHPAVLSLRLFAKRRWLAVTPLGEVGKARR